MLCLRGEIACQKGNTQKRDENQPVLRGSDAETPGRKEEVIQRRGSQPRRHGGFNKTPPPGNDQDSEKQQQDDGRNMDMRYGSAQRGDAGNDAEGNSNPQCAAWNAYPMDLFGCVEL